VTKLHEVLAAEKVPTAAWNAVAEETLKKFAAADSYFHGHSKSLAMTNREEAASVILQNQARSEKPVPTTVTETLEYALDLFGKSEDMQLAKNTTNIDARGTIMWKGKVLIDNVPVDQLMGMETRLQKVRQIILAAPTLDASKHWERAEDIAPYIWQLKFPEESPKTQKVLRVITMAPATKEHQATTQGVTEDVPVGQFTTMHRSGECTAAEKAEAIQNIDLLIVEIKQARVRTNETEVKKVKISDKLLPIILAPFQRGV
jgi:hypothetical protein